MPKMSLLAKFYHHNYLYPFSCTGNTIEGLEDYVDIEPSTDSSSENPFSADEDDAAVQYVL